MVESNTRKSSTRKEKKGLLEINKHIDKRCAAIQGELKYMLSSLLKRSSNKVQLDRVLVEKKEEIVLITEEKEVQQEVKSHFEKQFHKRQVKDSKFTSKWIEAYRSIDEIDESSYTALSEQE